MGRSAAPRLGHACRQSHTPRLAGQAAAAASGDAGARPFLRSHPELIDPVDCTHLSDGADVDRLLPLD
ncbi:hypothetical protein [Arthrobacter sp. Soil736]|uniref:hypothetical protein n=1 Tax=Arthrobacter sp. Soil736 TaxID=1736395 RepID=UPI0009E6ACA5